ncbi:hypothetical protein H6501_00260 [Candidatus Woesearchaeota archaeon]|nr:hypothetical protein [Nanoarchaeota archaeon]MCB9370015.1 hypothetical protein [Candidatus Woesearchaeota archaeon]USN44548.1 MAG: hypothetical protein H6500_01730 [Candidatus Woesearchaeota archaeon]
MNLFRFTKQSPKQEKEILCKKEELTISQEGEEEIFFIKSSDALSKCEPFLFMAPSESRIVSQEGEAQEFFAKSIADGVEGLMFKRLESPYKPGLRAGGMAKLKEVKDDLDLLVVGAERGKGKRAGFYSSFLVAVQQREYEDESERFLVVGKVSSGIKEKEDSSEGVSMQTMSELLEPLKIGEEKDLTFFEPKIILQVRYQEVQKSTQYSSGYALRFPRIITLREDKSLDEVAYLDEISESRVLH